MRVQHLEIPLGASLRRALRSLALPYAYDLYALVGVAAFLPLVLLIPSPLVRLLTGLVLVFWAPGYTVTAALFAREDDLDGVARAALSLGLSVATIPVLALVVDAIGWGIRPGPIVTSLSLWIVAWSAFAAIRRTTISPPTAAYRPPALERLVLRNAGDAIRRRHIFVGAVAAVLAPILVLLALPDPATHLTEFYIVGGGGRAEDYPRIATAGEELRVTTGIVNGELEDLTYRIEVWVVDPHRSGERTLAAGKGPITLPAGGRWEDQIGWRVESPGTDRQVEFLLYVGDRVEPYRRLHLWIDVVGTPSDR